MQDATGMDLPMPRNFVPCSWCGGRGCMACYKARVRRERELAAEYAAAFPDGIKPFFTALIDDPKQMEEARQVVGAEAIKKAFGPGGGGMDEILQRAKAFMDARQSTETKHA